MTAVTEFAAEVMSGAGGGTAAPAVPALPSHIERVPQNVRPFIPEEISKDLPTTGRLADLADEALAKVSRVERDRWAPFNEPGPDGQMAEHYAVARTKSNSELMTQHQIHSESRSRLATRMGQSGMTKTQVEENPAWQAQDSRAKAYGREILFRREWGEGMRQLSSLAEGNRRGVLVLTSEDVTNLLGQVRDRYVDTGLLDPKRPKHVEYSPEVFITSDLSGARARYYIVFPDGQIGHPDEIAEARQRGRIVVIGEIKTPPRTDWGPQ